MNRTCLLIFAFAVLLAACSSSTTNTHTASTTEASPPIAPVSPTTVPANEVVDDTMALVIAAVDFDAGLIQIRNDGDQPIGVGGLWLCNRPTDFELPSKILEPGAILELDASTYQTSVTHYSEQPERWLEEHEDGPTVQGNLDRTMLRGEATHGSHGQQVNTGITVVMSDT